jgi:Icc-related predicted phosphoesterase
MPPTRCLFASDLHGHVDRWEKLLAETEARRPDAVLVGGDLLPGGASLAGPPDFLRSWLGPRLEALRERMASSYPQIFAIFGNDDPRSFEPSLGALEAAGLLRHAHGRRLPLGAHSVYGYACVPPTPFALKDWERYDVSRYVDPGCVSPEEGRRSVAVLDRADLDGREIDHVPVDPHVGSIAIRRFLEARQPLVSLHGHVHESARLTGAWQARLGRTVCLSAAHDGPELALVRFDLEDPGAAVRELL